MQSDPPPPGARFRAAGYWLDKTADQLLSEAAARIPDKIAIVADRVDRETVRRFSYAELERLVDRVARSLVRLGVARGEVVTLQLPNWWEFVVTALACGRIGAVVNPVMPILRERELSTILNFCEARVFIVPKVYRGHDYAAMVEALRPELPLLRHLVVVGGEGPDSFENLLLAEHPGSAPIAASARLDPDALAVLMFTSGTTGQPKGVMHSSNSVIAAGKALAAAFGLGENDVLLVATPVGHMSGYAALAMMSIYLGATMVLQDVWEPVHGVALMAREAVTHTAASTPFLSDIYDVVKSGAPRPAALRSFLCGGAPIPSVLVERAGRELGIAVCSLWGMTEALGPTLTEPARAAEKSPTTDGRAIGGMEVCVVDDAGRPLPTGQPGRLLVRGPAMFSGYYKNPGLPAFDAEGWFDSGDLATMDEEGYIRICGRVKDILIRGGENIPVGEIEDLLYKHPAIAAAAIVGYPDARMGERACAFVVPRAGGVVDLATIQDYLAQCRMAKQYWPERVELVEDMPRTASGKIQKFKLKALAKEAGAEEA